MDSKHVTKFPEITPIHSITHFNEPMTTLFNINKIYNLCNEKNQQQLYEADSKKACLEIFYLKCLKDVYLHNRKEDKCYKIIDEYEKYNS